jgi:Tfp pilus assembly protein PilW
MTARRLRGDAGFTLPELLTTMWIAMVVLLAGFALLEFVMKRATETEQRVEATQRGRIAMDVITRSVRSAVCLDANTPPIVDGTPTQLTFYTDLGNSTASSLPEKHVLTFNSTAQEITESVSQPIAGKPVTWKTPTTRKILTGVTQDGTSPIFQYFPYDPTRSATLAALGTPLTTAGNLNKVARITISYRTVPLRNARAAVAVPLADDVYLRVVNPNPPEPFTGTYSPTPLCS